MKPTMRRFAHLPSVLMSLALLPGCSSILPARTAAPDIYALPAAVATRDAAQKPLALQLVVEVPLAVHALDTDRIAVRPSPYELSYLAGSRWPDTAPRIVQGRLVEVLEQSGVALAVGRAEDGLRGDIALVSDLRSFEIQTFGSGPPVVKVRLAAKLIARPLGETRAARLFEASVPAKNSATGNVIAAFDQALGAIAAGMVPWLREAAGAPASPAG